MKTYEEETKDGEDRTQDDPPKALVHEQLDILLALLQILHGELEGIQGPDIKCSKRSRERQNDQEDQRTSLFRCNCK